MLNCSTKKPTEKKKEVLLHLLRDRTCGLVRYLAPKIVTFMDFKCLQIQMEEVYYFGNIFKIIMYKYKFYPSMPSFYRVAFIPLY